MSLLAVIFDMDGVITDTVEFHYLAWQKVTAEFGIPFTQEDNERLRGLTRRRSLEEILNGKVIPEEQVQEILCRKNDYFLEHIAGMDSRALLPGVQNLLNEIKAAGYRAGVASGSRNTSTILQRLHIETFFDAVCDGNTVHRSKPAPDVFLHAAKALQVEPEDCLVIEDSLPGMQAARDVGMCVIGVGPAACQAPAHAVFPDLARVRLEDLLTIYWDWRSRLSARNSPHPEVYP